MVQVPAATDFHRLLSSLDVGIVTTRTHNLAVKGGNTTVRLPSAKGSCRRQPFVGPSSRLYLECRTTHDRLPCDGESTSPSHSDAALSRLDSDMPPSVDNSCILIVLVPSIFPCSDMSTLQELINIFLREPQGITDLVIGQIAPFDMFADCVGIHLQHHRDIFYSQ